MKKKGIIWPMLVTGLLLLTLVTGCSKKQSGDVEVKKKFVGISFPSTSVDRWQKEAEFLKTGLEKLGHRAEIQYADEKADLQNQQCENFFSQGIDLLVLCAVDTSAAISIVDAAHAENVLVVSYCRLIENADIDAFGGEDNDLCGVYQGQYAVDNLPKGNIVVLGGSPFDTNGRLYYRTALETLQPKVDSGDFKIVFSQPVDYWLADKAVSLMENALTIAGNDVQAVVCSNDPIAGGAIQALAAQGLAGKVMVIGGDGELAAIKRIILGTQTATLKKDSVKIATPIVTMIDGMLTGKDPQYNKRVNNGFKDVPSVQVDMTMVDIKNLKEEFIDSGIYTQAQIDN